MVVNQQKSYFIFNRIYDALEQTPGRERLYEKSRITFQDFVRMFAKFRPIKRNSAKNRTTNSREEKLKGEFNF